MNATPRAPVVGELVIGYHNTQWEVMRVNEKAGMVTVERTGYRYEHTAEIEKFWTVFHRPFVEEK